MKDDGCITVIGGLFLIAIAVAVLCLVVGVIIPITVSLGAMFGGGIALTNYSKSLIKNVRPEGDPNGLFAKLVVFLLAAVLAAGLYLLLFKYEGTYDLYLKILRLYRIRA